MFDHQRYIFYTTGPYILTEYFYRFPEILWLYHAMNPIKIINLVDMEFTAMALDANKIITADRYKKRFAYGGVALQKDREIKTIEPPVSEGENDFQVYELLINFIYFYKKILFRT